MSDEYRESYSVLRVVNHTSSEERVIVLKPERVLLHTQGKLMQPAYQLDMTTRL